MYPNSEYSIVAGVDLLLTPTVFGDAPWHSEFSHSDNSELVPYFTRMYSIVAGVDLLLTPTVLADAPWYSEFSQADNQTRTQKQDVFTQPVNIAGKHTDIP